MIFTSCFDKIDEFPKHIIPIAICAKCPEWYHGIHIHNFIPAKEWWNYKHDKGHIDYDKYIQLYEEHILSKLDADLIVESLYKTSKNRDIVLLCHENPNDFCYRHLVSSWLNQHGYASREWSV